MLGQIKMYLTKIWQRKFINITDIIFKQLIELVKSSVSSYRYDHIIFLIFISIAVVFSMFYSKNFLFKNSD